jgi:hypothetical protein
MIKQYWTKAQLPQLYELQNKHNMPSKVIDEIEKVISILDTYYGTERDFQNDDGGYILIMLPDVMNISESKRSMFLEKYSIQEDTAEYHDVVADGNTEWHTELYLISNDYGIVLVYPMRRGIK